MAKLANDRSPAWPVLGLGLGVRGGDSVKCGVRVQVGPRLRVKVRDGTGCGLVARIMVRSGQGCRRGQACGWGCYVGCT